MKKKLTLALALILAFSFCLLGSAEEEKPVITWLLNKEATYVDDNLVEEKINELLGIDLRVTNISDGYMTKLNTLIASGDLPDIFLCNGQTAIDLRDSGKLLDMTPYLEKYGPDILKAYSNGELDQLIVNQNGGVYGLCALSGYYISNLIIRKDWLANLGLEVPTTLDELYDVLYAFTYKDPDGNGKNDTFGYLGGGTIGGVISENWEHIFSAFGIPFGVNILKEDGTVTSFFKHEKFLDAMKYINKLYRDGILHPDFATLKGTDAYNLLWTGKLGIYGFRSIGTVNNWYPGRYTFDVPEDPSDLFAQVILKNEETGELSGGVKEYFNYQDYRYMVSASCKHPEKAIELINFLGYTEEGQELGWLGIEGVMFNWVDKEKGLFTRPAEYADAATSRAAGAIFSFGETYENIQTKTFKKLAWDMQIKDTEVAIDHAYIPVPLNTWIEYGSNLKDIVSECFCTMIVADGGLEDIYQQYLEQWNEEGGLEWEAEATNWWAENH